MNKETLLPGNSFATVDTKSTEGFHVSNGLDIVLDREEFYEPASE